MTETQRKDREQYLKAKAAGAWTASKKDATWDKVLLWHTCCGSRHGAYHKAACPIRSGDISDLQLRESEKEVDPVKLRVRELKAQGLTSEQVAAELGMQLRDVNKFWIG